MLRPDPNKSVRNIRIVPAFSLIELLVVIAIISMLLAASVQIFSDTSNRARQASRDLIKAHLQQARAHAIASGNATAIAIPVFETGGDLGWRAISMLEVEKSGADYSPAIGDSGEQRLLQRWESLPGNFHFVPASTISSARPTVVDTPDRLRTSYKGATITCHLIVFAPNGQIVLPTTAIHIAIAKATSQGGALIPTEKSGGVPVYEFLQVNRLTGRTRTIQP